MKDVTPTPSDISLRLFTMRCVFMTSVHSRCAIKHNDMHDSRMSN